jgi:hypothetical protein
MLTGEHAEHMAQRRGEDGFSAHYAVWPNPGWVDPAQARKDALAQAENAKEIAKNGARTMRGIQRRLARTEDPVTSHEAAEAYVAAQAHKTRLGKVAAHLIANVGLWIDAVDFTAPDVGGFAGTRRLRELREEYGWPVETRRKPGSAVSWQHRLTELPPRETE